MRSWGATAVLGSPQVEQVACHAGVEQLRIRVRSWGASARIRVRSWGATAVLGSQCGLGVSPSRAPGVSPQVEQVVNQCGLGVSPSRATGESRCGVSRRRRATGEPLRSWGASAVLGFPQVEHLACHAGVEQLKSHVGRTRKGLGVTPA